MLKSIESPKSPTTLPSIACSAMIPYGHAEKTARSTAGLAECSCACSRSWPTQLRSRWARTALRFASLVQSESASRVDASSGSNAKASICTPISCRRERGASSLATWSTVRMYQRRMAQSSMVGSHCSLSLTTGDCRMRTSSERYASSGKYLTMLTSAVLQNASAVVPAGWCAAEERMKVQAARLTSFVDGASPLVVSWRASAPARSSTAAAAAVTRVEARRILCDEARRISLRRL
mmetsp:Transcript_13968/g.36241  ORF Transcript_13968/g.36241 Transcript_13968/m.36241 type:complete len:236 (-) Transcript_13968:13-720(-)